MGCAQSSPTTEVVAIQPEIVSPTSARKCENEQKPQSIPPLNATLILLGLDAAGKSTILNNILGDPFGYVSATWGFNEKSAQVGPHKVTLFDVGGGRSIRGYWPRYFHEVHGIIFVVDSSNSKSMEEVKSVFQDTVKEPMVAGKPILVFANKQDLPSALSESEVSMHLGLDQLMNCRNSVMKCTALPPSQETPADSNIPKGINWLLQAIGENWDGFVYHYPLLANASSKQTFRIESLPTPKFSKKNTKLKLYGQLFQSQLPISLLFIGLTCSMAGLFACLHRQQATLRRVQERREQEEREAAAAALASSSSSNSASAAPEPTSNLTISTELPSQPSIDNLITSSPTHSASASSSSASPDLNLEQPHHPGSVSSPQKTPRHIESEPESLPASASHVDLLAPTNTAVIVGSSVSFSSFRASINASAKKGNQDDDEAEKKKEADVAKKLSKIDQTVDPDGNFTQHPFASAFGKSFARKKTVLSAEAQAAMNVADQAKQSARTSEAQGSGLAESARNTVPSPETPSAFSNEDTAQIDNNTSNTDHIDVSPTSAVIVGSSVSFSSFRASINASAKKGNQDDKEAEKKKEADISKKLAQIDEVVDPEGSFNQHPFASAFGKSIARKKTVLSAEAQAAMDVADQAKQSARFQDASVSPAPATSDESTKSLSINTAEAPSNASASSPTSSSHPQQIHPLASPFRSKRVEISPFAPPVDMEEEDRKHEEQLQRSKLSASALKVPPLLSPIPSEPSDPRLSAHSSAGLMANPFAATPMADRSSKEKSPYSPPSPLPSDTTRSASIASPASASSATSSALPTPVTAQHSARFQADADQRM